VTINNRLLTAFPCSCVATVQYWTHYRVEQHTVSFLLVWHSVSTV